jgi:hypothetical protein
MTTEGHRSLISYDGQPLTFCACHGTDHMVHNCQSRTWTQPSPINNDTATWLQIEKAIERTQAGSLTRFCNRHDRYFFSPGSVAVLRPCRILVGRGNASYACVIYLLQHLPQNCKVGGNLNYVPSRADCTGEYNTCEALETVAPNLDRVDAWTNNPQQACR